MVKKAAGTTGISPKTVVQIYQYLRDVCSTKLLNVPAELGGPGIIVQIDESLFIHKPKYQRDRRASKSYLDERMWRGRFGTTTEDACNNISKHIAEQYPV